MADLHDVPVLDEVLFSFQPQAVPFPSAPAGSLFHEIIVVTDFRANEVIFQIRVNHSGCALRVGSTRDCPGPAFFFADSEKGNKSKKR